MEGQSYFEHADSHELRQQLEQLEYWAKMDAVADAEIGEAFTGVQVTIPFKVWYAPLEERQHWVRLWGRQEYLQLVESYEQVGNEQGWRDGQQTLVMKYRRMLLSLELLTPEDTEQFRASYENDELFRERYVSRQGDMMHWTPPGDKE